MKAIIIKGESESGKTSAINYIYKYLLNKGAEAFEEREKEQVGKNAEDFKHVLCYLNVKIAFYSAGDLPKQIQSAKLWGKKSDILICACNNKNINEIEKIKKMYHQVHEFSMDNPENKDFNDLLEELLVLMLEIINN